MTAGCWKIDDHDLSFVTKLSNGMSYYMDKYSGLSNIDAELMEAKRFSGVLMVLARVCTKFPRNLNRKYANELIFIRFLIVNTILFRCSLTDRTHTVAFNYNGSFLIRTIFIPAVLPLGPRQYYLGSY